MLATVNPSEIVEKVQQFLPDRLKLLRHLVEQNSFTENIEGVNKIQSMLEDAFWELGLVTEQHKIPKRGHILVGSTSQGAKSPILLVGHADTVHPPSSDFRGYSVSGDTARGPGVFDMKSGLIMILTALDVLKSLNKLSQLPIKVLVNSAEENSNAESVQKICELSRGARAALVFELGRENNGLVVERKGIIELWIHSVGKEAHSGNNFYEGKNAIAPLIEIAQKAISLTDTERGVTVNVARIDGGTQLCVVPGKGMLGMEIRGGTVEVMDEALQEIESIACTFEGVTVHIDTKTAPLNKLSGTDELLKEIIDAGRLFGLDCAPLPRVGGLSDANLIGSQGVPTIDALGPIGKGAHTKEESIQLSSIAPRIAMVVQYLLRAR